MIRRRQIMISIYDGNGLAWKCRFNRIFLSHTISSYANHGFGDNIEIQLAQSCCDHGTSVPTQGIQEDVIIRLSTSYLCDRITESLQGTLIIPLFLFIDISVCPMLWRNRPIHRTGTTFFPPCFLHDSSQLPSILVAIVYLPFLPQGIYLLTITDNSSRLGRQPTGLRSEYCVLPVDYTQYE